MAWPLASHFSTMMQTPQVAFRDAELKKCTILRNSQGQPKPWAGAFAVVYKATLEDGTHRAVRVFSSESPERHERYELISQYLSGKQLDCLVQFEYRDAAIRSTDGKWYPMILMDWVDGMTLFQWVDGMCKAKNVSALRMAAEVWLGVARELEDAGIAHGDYQQANIMVTPQGRMKLVDYDCMCVPALVGRRNLEIGVEPYQHPSRDGATKLALDMDHFSALMIYLALRALAADVSLWENYVVLPDYDKLMFRKEDIQNPNESPLIKDLMASKDPEVQEFTSLLLRCAALPMAQVPTLWVATSPIRRVEPLLKAKKWREAVEQLQSLRLQDVPTHLKPLIEQAYEEVWKERAWQDYQTLTYEVSEKGDRAVCRVCNDAFLQQFPVPEEVKQHVGQARVRVELLDRLAQMAKLSEGKQILSGERSIAAIGEQFAPDYVYGLRKRVEKAQKAVKMIEELLQKLQEPVPNEIQIADAWMGIRKNRFQELLPTPNRERAELALKRAPRLKMLRSVKKETPLDQMDKQVLQAWDEKLLNDCPQAQKYRKWYDMALRRRVILEKLREAVQYNDSGRIAAILAEPLLKGYPLDGQMGTVVKSRAELWNHACGMLGAIQEGNPQTFVQQFDIRAIVENSPSFEPSATLLGQWIVEWILPRKQNGLKPAMGRASLLPGEKGTVMVRWTWPAVRFGDACFLGISPTAPLTTDRPEDLQLVLGQEISRIQWEQMGSCLTLQPESAWNGMHVIVWGVIRWGTQTWTTEPLDLGTLTVKKKSWFGW
ncbi:MAG: hypothetical protein Q4D62_06015 [Planctomycetia bacterium]|nr:hypothetical protein [Planctomycetia bacterium]